MLGRHYPDENCSAARALEHVGERWSLLIVRDALFRGRTRFSDFQRSLGLAPNVLAARLESFVAAGIMEVKRTSDKTEHPRYVLTEKGRDLAPVILALTSWGDSWAAPAGPPIVFEHAECEGHVRHETRCLKCGELVPPARVTATSGPGARQ